MATRAKRSVTIEPVPAKRASAWSWTPALLVAVVVAVSNFAGTPSCSELQTKIEAKEQTDRDGDTHKRILDEIKDLRSDYKELLRELLEAGK